MLHLGVPGKYAAEGPVLSVTHGGVTFRATIVAPKGAVWAGVTVPPVMNFGHFSTENDDVRVVLTLSRGRPPGVTADTETLTIGRQTYTWDGVRPHVAAPR